MGSFGLTETPNAPWKIASGVAFCGLLAWLAYGHSGFMLRPDNRTLAFQPDGLAINLRQPYPPITATGLCVAELRYREILSVNEHKRVYYPTWIDNDGPRSETDKESFHLRPGRKRKLAKLGKFVALTDATLSNER